MRLVLVFLGSRHQLSTALPLFPQGCTDICLSKEIQAPRRIDKRSHKEGEVYRGHSYALQLPNSDCLPVSRNQDVLFEQMRVVESSPSWARKDFFAYLELSIILI